MPKIYLKMDFKSNSYELGNNGYAENWGIGA